MVNLGAHLGGIVPTDTEDTANREYSALAPEGDREQFRQIKEKLNLEDGTPLTARVRGLFNRKDAE